MHARGALGPYQVVSERVVSYDGDSTPTGRMAGGDPGQGRGSLEDESTRAVVPYGGGPTPMEVNGSCPGGSEI